MKQKQSMVVLVDYKDNYDTATMTANKSMGFDLSAIQSCFFLQLLLYINRCQEMVQQKLISVKVGGWFGSAWKNCQTANLGEGLEFNFTFAK